MTSLNRLGCSLLILDKTGEGTKKKLRGVFIDDFAVKVKQEKNHGNTKKYTKKQKKRSNVGVHVDFLVRVVLVHILMYRERNCY